MPQTLFLLPFRRGCLHLHLHFHGSLSPSLAGGMKTEQQLCLEPENIILSSMIKKLDKLITLQVSPLHAPHLLSSFHLIADGFLSEYG